MAQNNWELVRKAVEAADSALIQTPMAYVAGKPTITPAARALAAARAYLEGTAWESPEEDLLEEISQLTGRQLNAAHSALYALRTMLFAQQSDECCEYATKASNSWPPDELEAAGWRADRAAADGEVAEYAELAIRASAEALTV
jgi:hypothetical protein